MYVLSRVAHGHRVVPGLDLETRKDPLLRKVMRLHSPARIWSQPKTSVLQLVEDVGPPWSTCCVLKSTQSPPFPEILCYELKAHHFHHWDSYWGFSHGVLKSYVMLQILYLVETMCSDVLCHANQRPLQDNRPYHKPTRSHTDVLLRASGPTRRY